MKITKCAMVMGTGLLLAAGAAQAGSSVSWSVSVGSGRCVPVRSYYPSYCPGTGAAVGVVYNAAPAPVYYSNAYYGQPVMVAAPAPVVVAVPPAPVVVAAPMPPPPPVVVYPEPAAAVGIGVGAVELSFGIRDWHRAPAYCPPPRYYWGDHRGGGHDNWRGGYDRHDGGDRRGGGPSHR